MILYLNYEWNSSCVCISTDHGKEYRPCRSVSAFLNKRCQQEGSTLKGRREAFAQIMTARKHIPILTSIRRRELFMPFGPCSSPDAIWINLGAVSDYHPMESETCITLVNGEHLTIPYRYSVVRRQMERSRLYIDFLS